LVLFYSIEGLILYTSLRAKNQLFFCTSISAHFTYTKFSIIKKCACTYQFFPKFDTNGKYTADAPPPPNNVNIEKCLTTGDFDTGGKFVADINGTSGKLAAGVLDWWCILNFEYFREFSNSFELALVK
jgi:hypothetical protein